MVLIFEDFFDIDRDNSFDSVSVSVKLQLLKHFSSPS